MRLLLVRGVALVALGLAGCASGEDAPPAVATTPSAAVAATVAPPSTPSPAPEATATPQVIEVRLTDFGVSAEPADARAGAVTFLVRNDGAIPHEFVIVASDLAAPDLPQPDQKAVDETAVKVIARIDPFDGGLTREATVTLEAGRYVLVCNVASHYISGMYAGFLVR